jgi:hypothetical protein
MDVLIVQVPPHVRVSQLSEARIRTDTHKALNHTDFFFPMRMTVMCDRKHVNSHGGHARAHRIAFVHGIRGLSMIL